MIKLETWSRAPRNLDEVQIILQAMAKRVGQTYGVFLNVGRRGDALIFVEQVRRGHHQPRRNRQPGVVHRLRRGGRD